MNTEKLNFSFFKKHKSTSIIVSIVLFCLFCLFFYIYYSSNDPKSIANQECKKLILDEANKYSFFTGVTADKVVLNDADEVEVSGDVYTLKWNQSIGVGGRKISFVCQYDFSTKKATEKKEDTFFSYKV
ncbi:MAG: hypothetical protein Kow0076_8070 [Francisella sp.]